MTKKVLTVLFLLLSIFTLAACQKKTFNVTFDSQGGTAVAAMTIEEGALVTEPEDPTRVSGDEIWSFIGWFTDAAATQEYDFEAPVEADITLYAGWSQNLVVRFNTKTTETLSPALLPLDGGTIASAPIPTREGYRFGGWFYGKPGLTWLETTPVAFPLEVDESLTLYAYWEPIDSKAVSYSEGETYTSSLTSDTALNLNPLVYEWSHETDLIDMLVTPLFTTEVDWDLAIEEGVADAPGDFSKIINKEFSVEALDYHYILGGATKYPVDSEGDEHLDENGKYDRQAATTYKDTVWTFSIREDMKFEDGTPITAETFEYTLKQFLDPLQNNYRSTIFYKTEENKNGYPILNAYEYYLNEVTDFAEVGFKVVDDYTFTVTFFEAVSQATAVGFGNDLRLLHPEKFEASLTKDKTKSTYGTPANPFVSYGAYIIKSWDENQKIVMNKNYDYVLKGTINYKSQVIQIVDNVDQRMQLFAAGQLSVAGLSQEYYAEYAENANVYKSWDGYPQYLVINTAASKLGEDGIVQSPMIFNVKFRQALLYGFDRKYYANNVYAPNTASLLPVPLDTKSYIQDPLYYSESPAHLAILNEFGIDPTTEGYIPDRAIALFNEAYDEWVAEGNSGVITVTFSSDNNEFSVNLVEYIESHYEELFGADKFNIEIVYSSPDAQRASLRNWNFEISLNSIGFGASYGVFWQFQAIAFMGDFIGGGGLGLSQPHDLSTEDGYGEYLYKEIEVDLTATYDYLVELGEDYMVENELLGHLELLGYLEATTDEETGEITKEAGIYKGSLYDIGMLMVSMDTPYDGTAAEPFPGATSDTWNLVAAFERVFFEYAPLIPTVTRSSATVYADNVVITWPAYSAAFGWGAGRYRYLNTDPDFQ
ncbi:MAG: ABC transporter substrate-binding protein [Acholeplasmataceae bacterium]|nr:ABC transporter substrate-binding protein [Acholeplasmataceae bacterium]